MVYLDNGKRFWLKIVLDYGLKYEFICINVVSKNSDWMKIGNVNELK